MRLRLQTQNWGGLSPWRVLEEQRLRLFRRFSPSTPQLSSRYNSTQPCRLILLGISEGSRSCGRLSLSLGSPGCYFRGGSVPQDIVTELQGSMYSRVGSSFSLGLGEYESSCEVYLRFCGRCPCCRGLQMGCFLKFCTSSDHGHHPSSSPYCVRTPLPLQKLSPNRVFPSIMQYNQ